MFGWFAKCILEKRLNIKVGTSMLAILIGIPVAYFYNLSVIKWYLVILFQHNVYMFELYVKLYEPVTVILNKI